MILVLLYLASPNINCKAEFIYDLLFTSCSADLLRLWKVFSDDKERPDRYLLAKEFESRPDADDIEVNSFNFKLHCRIQPFSMYMVKIPIIPVGKFFRENLDSRKIIIRERKDSKFVGE